MQHNQIVHRIKAALAPIEERVPPKVYSDVYNDMIYLFLDFMQEEQAELHQARQIMDRLEAEYNHLRDQTIQHLEAAVEVEQAHRKLIADALILMTSLAPGSSEVHRYTEGVLRSQERVSRIMDNLKQRDG